MLVLSRTAGAFQQLAKGSIPTSPTDVNETAQALYKAITLSPEERHTKSMLARQAVERSDLNSWLTKQINDINELVNRSVAASLVSVATKLTTTDGSVVSHAG